MSHLLDEIEGAVRILQDKKSPPAGISKIVELTVPEELVVIGDIHGDLNTLICILQKISFRRFCANPNNKLVFLGDYIDRGRDSVGVLQTVCYLKRAYPESVVLLCGNHEAIEKFHFSAHTLPQELKSHYGAKSNIIYDKILHFFRLLPEIVIIDGQLIIAHGGLPATDGNQNIFDAIARGGKTVDEEILWNDPRADMPDDLDWCKSRRPFGKHFGKNITKKHLEFTRTKMLIRGHEPCYGFRVDHDGLVLTLFSSKEPYEKFDAAYLHINSEQMNSVSNAEEIVQYIKKINEEC